MNSTPDQQHRSAWAAAGLCGALLVGLVAGGCEQPNGILAEHHQAVAAPLGSISVYQLAGRLDMSVSSSSSGNAVLRDRRNTVMLFAEPTGQVFVNGRKVSYQGRITPVSEMLFVPDGLTGRIRPHLRAIGPAPAPVSVFEPPLRRRALVVLDPGHGGKDPGAVKYGISEKSVNLAVGLEAAGRLRRMGVDVMLTRSDDRFIPLNERAEIANRAGASLFVSIHADSCPTPDVDGFTAYVARSPTRASIRAAQGILRRLRQATGATDRGLRRADFRVLVRTGCPAVLVELGYLTNGIEAVKLADRDYQRRLAEALALGVTDFVARDQLTAQMTVTSE